jgi:soluble lytic murein transglycosylase-like protein
MNTNRAFLVVLAVVLLGCSTGSPYDPSTDPDLLRANRRVEAHQALIALSHADKAVFPNIENFLEGHSPALALYREDVTRDSVTRFFVDRAGGPEIALPILYYADRLDISLSLVFSLVWMESRFTVNAVNHNGDSIDRGLFQLNSKTFRTLSEADFFNPETNAYHGLRYLRFCLQQGRTDNEALAIYNAGMTRVLAGRTPASTLRYVDMIAGYRRQLETEFADYILANFPPSVS